MRITFKTLEQKTFSLEIDPSASISDLKNKISETNGSSSAALKLIYAGIVLEDQKSIAEYGIDEKKFVVVMINRAVAASALTETAKAPSETTATSSSSETAAAVMAAVETKKEPETTSKPEEENKNVLQSLIEMGYDKESAEIALRASFNDPDRAVEYLINGLPESFQDIAFEATPSESNVAAAAAATAAAPTTTGSSSEHPLEFLRNQPQFQQMKSLLETSPELLSTVLQQIGQTNPRLLQIISQHQTEFLAMLNEPRSESNAPSSNPSSEENPGSNTIRITPQDKEAIERLKALGFEEHLVLQAYFACEKNENSAANFLLSSAMED